MIRWPFAFRYTVDHQRIVIVMQNDRILELGRALAEAQNELHRYKMLLGQGSGGMAIIKKAVERTT